MEHQTVADGTPELPLLRGLFWRVETYRWIRRLRRRVLDVAVAVPLIVVGLVWEWRRGDMRPLPPGWAEGPDHSWVVLAQPSNGGPHWLEPQVATAFIDRWINASHAAAWFPVLVALVVHLVLRGRLAHYVASEPWLFDYAVPTPRDWAKAAKQLLLVPAGAIALAVYLLWGGYGAWTARYVPLIVGVGGAVLLGRFEERRLRRPQTLTGYRVPARMLLSSRGRRAVRDVATQQTLMQAGAGWWHIQVVVDGRPQESDPEKVGERVARREWLFARAEVFRAVGGAPSLGWFTAWAVETCVHLGDMDTAEDLLRRAGDVPGAGAVKACRAAEARLLDGIGARDAAAAEWREALDAPRRAPLAVRVYAEPGVHDATGGIRSSVWWLARLAWWRSGHLLVLELAARLRHDWPDAMVDVAAERLERIAEAVAAESLAGGVTAYAEATRARASALRSVGEARAAAGERVAAADAYFTAFETFLQVKDRRAAGQALAWTSLSLLAHPRTRTAEAEHALDLLRVALGLVEECRVALREPVRRSAVARQDEPLHDTVLDLLADETRCPMAKRAELALWLLESRRRATRDHVLCDPRVPSGVDFARLWDELEQREAGERVGLPQPDADWITQWQRTLGSAGLAGKKEEVRSWIDALHAVLPTPESADVSPLLSRIGDGVLLMFHTRRRADAWTIDTVLASARTGPALHRSVLRAPAGPHATVGEPSAIAHDAALTLDALDRGDREVIRHLTRTVECDLLAWKDIAAAVLPPGLDQVLTASSSDPGRPPVLIVVPDGPVAALPLVGLPLTEEHLLGERALVTLTPSLSVLRPPGTSRAGARRAVLHLDAEGLHSYETEARLREYGPARLQETADRDSLLRALSGEPTPDVVLIAAHGESVAVGSGEGATVERLPRLADGTTLSAVTALGLRWPPLVALATCWVGRLDTAFGHDPVSFPLSCFLRGARTILGATGPLHDATASQLFGGAVGDVLGGQDLWAGLTARLRPMLRNAYGEAALPAAGPGVAFWTLQPPVASVPDTYSPVWDRSGVPVDEDDAPATARPRTGHEVRPAALSEALRTALRHAAEQARDRGGVVDTWGLAASLAATDPVGRWDDFFAPEPARPGSTTEDEEATVDVVLPDDTWVEVTVPVAVVLDFAELLRSDLWDETLLPQHAVYGLLHATDSNAYQRLGFGSSPRQQWLERLAAHAFHGIDLPRVGELTAQHRAGEGAPEQPEDEVVWRALQAVGRRYRKAVLTVAAVVAILLGFFLPGMEHTATTPSLGVQVRPVELSDNTTADEIDWLVPGGPAAAAGLHNGDLVIAHGPLTGGTVSLLVSSPAGSPSRRVTLTPVVPRCLVTDCPASPGHRRASGPAGPAPTSGPAPDPSLGHPLFHYSGTGDRQVATAALAVPWHLQWWYQCGTTSSFEVDDDALGGQAVVSGTAPSGSGVYEGEGTSGMQVFRVVTGSDCAWWLTVYGRMTF